MLHEKVAFGAKRERRDRWVCPEESLVVRVVSYTVVSGRVVVHKAEIVGFPVGDTFNEVAEGVEAGWDGARGACISGSGDGRFSLGVDEPGGRGRGVRRCWWVARYMELRRLVDAKHGGEARRVDLRVDATATDRVLHAIKREFGA